MPNGPSEQERRYISGDIRTGNILDVVNTIVDQEERENFARRNKPLIVMTDINEQLKKLNAGIGLLNALTDSYIKMQARQIKLEEAKISDFQTFYIEIPLISTTRLVHIDFVKASDSKNIPSNAVIDYPMKPVRQIMIQNRGTGNMKYAINVDGKNSSKANVELGNGEVDTWADQSGFASIKNMNIVINDTTAATVNIILVT